MNRNHIVKESPKGSKLSTINNQDGENSELARDNLPTYSPGALDISIEAKRPDLVQSNVYNEIEKAVMRMILNTKEVPSYSITCYWK